MSCFFIIKHTLSSNVLSTLPTGTAAVSAHDLLSYFLQLNLIPSERVRFHFAPLSVLDALHRCLGLGYLLGHMNMTAISRSK